MNGVDHGWVINPVAREVEKASLGVRQMEKRRGANDAMASRENRGICFSMYGEKQKGGGSM